MLKFVVSIVIDEQEKKPRKASILVKCLVSKRKLFGVKSFAMKLKKRTLKLGLYNTSMYVLTIYVNKIIYPGHA